MRMNSLEDPSHGRRVEDAENFVDLDGLSFVRAALLRRSYLNLLANPQ